MVAMGAAARIHRYRTPLALALVLVLAGSASTSRQPEAADQVASPSSSGADPGPASVTRIEPQPYPTVRGGTPAPAVRISTTRSRAQGAVARVDIADVLLTAYRSAAASAPASCHLPVSLLAAIGQVESGSLADVPLDARHRASVLGPVLDGRHGFKAVKDTDGGRWDGNRRWDRAVGPLQFIPSTWRTFGVDGDGDGVADPQDVEDAAATAAAYLCYGGRDLSRPSTLRAAVLAYNASAAYEALVLTYQKRYAALGLDRGISVVGLSTVVSAAGAPVAGLALGETKPSTTVAPARRHAATKPTATSGGATRTAAAAGTSAGTTTGTRAGTPAAGSSTGSSAGPSDGTSAKPTGRPTTGGGSSKPTGDPSGSPSGSPGGSPGGSPSGSPTPTDPTTCPPPPTDGTAPGTDPGTTDPGTTGTDPSATDPATCPPCPTADTPGGTGTGTTGSTGGTGSTGDTGTCPAEDPATAASPSSAP
jgi:membrane-bound lytic murein transglycosylase B